MKKLMLIMLCAVSASVFAADPATMAALSQAAGEMMPENLQLGIDVSVVDFKQKMDQIQKLDLGDRTIATIIQEGGQEALAKAIDQGQITSPEQLPGWSAKVGVSVTKVKQSLKQDHEITVGEDVILNLTQKGNQKVSY